MKKFYIVLLILINEFSYSQVGIGTSTPNENAVLELNSTSQGLKFPRLTSLQRNSINLPAKGLTVFDIQLNRLMTNFGTPNSPIWKAIGGLPIINQISTPSSAAYALRLVNSNYSGDCIKVRRSSDNLEKNIGFLNGVLDTQSLLNFTNIPNILDQVNGAKAAYSIRLLSNSYIGSCMRVRRSSDNVEQDIGFSNGVLNTTALLAFVGSNSAFVVKLYDQSGNSLDAIQLTASLQARIVNSGVIETINNIPAINFSPTGLVTGYQINFNDSTLNNWTISTVFQSNQTTFTTTLPMIFDTATTRLTLNQFGTTNVGPTFSIGTNFANNYGNASGTIQGNQNLTSAIGILNNTSISIAHNGSVLATAASAKTAIPTFATLGCRNSFDSHWFKGKVSEMLIYPVAVSVDNRRNIEASQNAFFGIQMTVSESNANAFITTWYDQSGNNRNLIQNSNSAQPRIVNGGILETAEGKPTLYFDGLASHLFRDEAFIYAQGNATILTVFKGNNNSANAGKVVISEGNSTINTPSYIPFIFSSTFANWPTVFYRNSANNGLTTFPVLYNDTFETSADLKIYAIEDTGSSFKGILKGLMGNLVNYARSETILNVFSVGVNKRTNLQNYFTGNISEIIIAPLLSPSDRQLFQSNQNNYFFPPSIPSAPTSINVNARNGEVLLSWSSPISNGGHTISDYKIEYKISSDSNWTEFNDSVTNLTNRLITGLSNNILYNFRISAINSLGIGQPSTIVNSTPLNNNFIPTSPQNLSYFRTNGQIILNWTAPLSNGNETINDYLIEYKLSSSSTWNTFNDGVSYLTNITISTLSDNSIYDFRVSATNSVGNSEPSSILNVLIPQNVVLSPLNSKILVQWAPVINATSYKVEYRIQGDTNWTSYTTPNSNYRGYEINGLNNGTVYEIKVSSLLGIETLISTIKFGTPSINSASLINNQILVNGQSLSIGYAGGVALTTTQPYNNKMLDFPTNINYNLGIGGAVLESDYTGLVPLLEPNRGVFNNNLETSSSAMANMISSLTSPIPFNSILSLHGIGGKQYSELKKGGTLTSYENGQAQSRSAMNFSLIDSKGYKVKAIAIIHGERDQALSTPIATYESNLVEWQNNYDQDAKQLTGQSENVPMFISQNSSWTGYNFTTPTIALAQLNAIRNNPNKIYLTTPYYIFDYVDTAHIKNWGYRRAGEYFGKVMKKVLVDNENWKPVMPIQVVRAENIIEARFNVPVAPLVFDTNAVISKLNYGFEYFDSSNSATISNIEIVGGDIVRITLNQIPVGSTQKLRYAYTGVNTIVGSRNSSAPSGNLRDSDATPVLYNDINVPSWAGSTLPNWSVTFDDSVITAPSKPQNLSGIINSGQIDLNWTAPLLDGGNSILDYIIEYKTSTSNTWNVLNDGTNTNTQAVIQSVLNGSNYNIRVSAVNSSSIKGLIEIINL